jgi:fructan beta-fructosidase
MNRALALLSIAGTLLGISVAKAAPDVVIADFEGKDYGDWKAAGEAFGPGPARGTLPRQNAVTGFAGKGLVNSYFGGDRSTGMLISPEFVVCRKCIKFLIGGGGYPGKTCINLLVDGNVVRSATGPNTKPGGTEHLDPASWDVSDLAGKRARIQIVDDAKGGWGHINVDQIVQTDERPPAMLADQTREIVLDKRYLIFPVKDSSLSKKDRKFIRKMKLIVDGRTVREFDIELADKDPAWWATLDVGPWKGKRATLFVDKLPEGSLGLKSIETGDSRKAESVYRETYRPQFHFTPRQGWMNDPNGLLYYQGQYHLFFQHNPYGVKWGNMHWGHAVSRDLVHWTEQDIAIYPDALGVCFSGSGVVDHHNTTGFQTGPDKPLVLIYTSMGAQGGAQSLCYSADGGKTWTNYVKNPVLDNLTPGNRDPKVIWHEPTKQWIMALFLSNKKELPSVYALFRSPDLKTWTKLCEVEPPKCGECPDLFELPVDGNPNDTRWVFWGGSGNYWIGRFDGRQFKIESDVQSFHAGGFYYAAQSWSDIAASDGRRIQVAWMSGGKYPGMPFSQQFSFPRELTLRTTASGIRLFCNPVREIVLLHEKGPAWNDRAIKPDENLLSDLSGDLFDIQAEIELGDAREIGFDLRGIKIRYDATKKSLSCEKVSTPLEPIQGRIKLQVLLDRTSVEVIANGGLMNLNHCFVPDADNPTLTLSAQGGQAKVVSLKVYPLRSAWE